LTNSTSQEFQSSSFDQSLQLELKVKQGLPNTIQIDHGNNRSTQIHDESTKMENKMRETSKPIGTIFKFD